jgi:hypothetical protein
VIEGQARLVDWGTVARNDLSRLQLRVERLINRYTPQCVIVPGTARHVRRPHAFLRIIQTISAKEKIRCRPVAPAKDHAGKKTKHRRATEISERFFELKPWLPKKRRPWTSEAEVMAIFDAIALLQQA